MSEEHYGPTVYAKLMDERLATPMPQWKQAVEMHVRGLAEGLTQSGLDVLREAYVAGLRDGFAQGVAYQPQEAQR